MSKFKETFLALLLIGVITTGVANAGDMFLVGSLRYGRRSTERLEKIVGPSAILASAGVKEKVGCWIFKCFPRFKTTYTNYLLRASDRQQTTLRDMGFQPLTSGHITVELKRISDINGWGTEVNGEVHVATNFAVNLGESLPIKVSAVGGFLTSPFKSAEKMLQVHFQPIFFLASVASFERGFRVSAHVILEVSDLSAGLPRGQQSMRFETYNSSRYFGLTGEDAYFSVERGEALPCEKVLRPS